MGRLHAKTNAVWSPVCLRASYPCLMVLRTSVRLGRQVLRGAHGRRAWHSARPRRIVPAMTDEIQTERLVLRPLRASDAEHMHAYRGDSEIARFQSWDTQSLDEVRAFIAEQTALRHDEPGWYQLAIARR